MAHAAPMARDERRLSQSSPPGSTARTRVQKREESVENRSSCYHVGRPNGPTKDNPLYPRLLVQGYTGSEEGEQDLYEPGQPAELVTWELSWKSSKGSEDFPLGLVITTSFLGSDAVRPVKSCSGRSPRQMPLYRSVLCLALVIGYAW